MMKVVVVADNGVGVFTESRVGKKLGFGASPEQELTINGVRHSTKYCSMVVCAD